MCIEAIKHFFFKEGKKRVVEMLIRGGGIMVVAKIKINAFCACLKLGLGFPTSYVVWFFFMFSELG